MEVADFFLGDGGEWVNRIEPCVQGGLLGQLLKAGILELSRVLNSVDLFDELRALGQYLSVVDTEVVDVFVEVING